MENKDVGIEKLISIDFNAQLCCVNSCRIHPWRDPRPMDSHMHRDIHYHTGFQSLISMSISKSK